MVNQNTFSSSQHTQSRPILWIKKIAFSSPHLTLNQVPIYKEFYQKLDQGPIDKSSLSTKTYPNIFSNMMFYPCHPNTKLDHAPLSSHTNIFPKDVYTIFLRYFTYSPEKKPSHLRRMFPSIFYSSCLQLTTGKIVFCDCPMQDDDGKKIKSWGNFGY